MVGFAIIEIGTLPASEMSSHSHGHHMMNVTRTTDIHNLDVVDFV